jgi:uncharacterized DUF497 family protein
VLEAFTIEAIDVRYGVVDGEERWTSVGHTNEMRISVIARTMRGEAIRPVTAFEAGKQLAPDYLTEEEW